MTRRARKPVGHRVRRSLPLPASTARIEEAYATALIRVVVRPCRERVAPLQRALREAWKTQSAERTDASDDIKKHLNETRAKLTRAIVPSHVEAVAKKFADRTHKHQKDQFRKQIRHAIGIDVLIKDKGLNKRVGAFVRENVALVKKIPQRLRDDLEDLVRGTAGQGGLNSDLAEKIEDRLDIEERRARLIARDQISKLNADVNHSRQQELGINHGVWRCMKDERVRGNPIGKYPDALPSHWDLEGLVFDYDDPPQPEGSDDPILPGDDVQCRCYSEPYLEDLLDLAEGGDEGDDEDQEEGAA